MVILNKQKGIALRISPKLFLKTAQPISWNLQMLSLPLYSLKTLTVTRKQCGITGYRE